MSIIRRVRRQDAVYWGNPQPDGTGGHTFDAPIQIRVRWVDHHEVFINALGEEETSRSTALVDRELDEGGYLLLGTLPQSSDPYTLPNQAFCIRAARRVPNIRATENLRKVWLV